jgi:hypothetical protein
MEKIATELLQLLTDFVQRIVWGEFESERIKIFTEIILNG